MKLKRARVHVYTLSLLIAGCGGEDSKRMMPTDASAGGSQDTSAADAFLADATVIAADAQLVDGASADALVDAIAPAGSAVYATFGGTLVRINPETGVSTVVGTLKNAAMPTQTFSDVSMAYSQGNQALAVLGFMSPRLGLVDLCSGFVTVGATLTRAASPNLVVEGIAQHPNGTWYVSSGNSNLTLSPNVATVDVTTGVITSLGGSVTTVQNDIDGLFFLGTNLYGFDVATDTNKFELFSLDLVSGLDVDNVVATQLDETLRVAYDSSRTQSFAWRAGDRQLLRIDLSTAAVTPIGVTHAANAYNGAPIRGFFVAPPILCAPKL